MNRVSKPVLFLLLAAAVVAGTLVLMGQAKPKPFLPGLTVADEHPNGCVDCHKNQGEGKDYRLNVSLAQIKGHPKIDAIVKKLPDNCAICHKAAGKVSPLEHHTAQGPLREGVEKNPFVQVYQGACLNCHKLDAASGKLTMKSSAEELVGAAALRPALQRAGRGTDHRTGMAIRTELFRRVLLQALRGPPGGHPGGSAPARQGAPGPAQRGRRGPSRAGEDR